MNESESCSVKGDDVIRLERNDARVVRWMSNVKTEGRISGVKFRNRLQLNTIRESDVSSIIPSYLKLAKVLHKCYNKSMFFLKTVYNVSSGTLEMVKLVLVFIVIIVIFIIHHGVDFIKKFNSLKIFPFQMYLRMG